MTVDHFQPRVQGGDEGADNLVYCCHACNEFKGDYWKVESDNRLLHPLLDDLASHYSPEDDGKLHAMTIRGTITSMFCASIVRNWSRFASNKVKLRSCKT